ncbi:alpha/beta hydrolase [Phyllobacterium myrsinacearum]|uniref:Carboxylesterase n=1 Tax=Phyllobacterium myrsinacearum TaxID=28101 RepID=A0A839ESV3_9HYPH|nr:alpha/beta fold hydrolase [Phyllobacterium myrsinacearum]MBA8881268.1 carboxylesterase [Phyllobacterium myrsinacearum]
MQMSDGLSYFLEGSNGKGVLLVHGLTGAPAEMKMLARQLNRKGYSVYAPLLAGHGVDMATLTRSRWQDWLESVHEATEKFAPYTDKTFAAGICIGGKLSMMAAHQKPDSIKAVAIYSPCFHYDGWNVPHYYWLLSPFIELLSHIPAVARLNFSETSALGIKDERIRRMMESMSAEGVIDKFPGKGIAEMYRLGKALKKTLPQMRTPTLILHAMEDDLSSPKHARYISRHIGGPHQLKWIEDSYHMIHVDRQRQKVGDYTAEFFEANNAPAHA